MDDVAATIEHTVLGPETKWSDVSTVLDDAIKFGMRACIPPCFIERATDYAPMVDLTTVIGFPHGQHTTATKCQEAEQTWKLDVAEVDVVTNLGYLKAGESELLAEELAEIVASVPIPVKLIVESDQLHEDELHEIGALAEEAGLAYLKTSTGFSGSGATVEDVEILRQYLPVKASGGVNSWDDARRLFDAGADRIGSSSGDVIVREYQEMQTATE